MAGCFWVTTVVTSVIAILSASAVITLIVLWSTVLNPLDDYALVIDAGSSHTKIFLYSWLADKSDGIGRTSRVKEVAACDVGGINGGPITLIRNVTVQNVENYFNSAMSDCVQKVPETRKSRTLIFLGATAGLRLLNISDPNYTSNLLNSTRYYFRSLGLRFLAPETQVRIIDGTEEALSAWITTNMLTRELFENNQPMQTYGVLDMGGASTQISFIAPNATQDKYSLNLFNMNYDIYSHSYLCSGQFETRNVYLGRLVEQGGGSIVINDPCLQKDFMENVSFTRLNSTPCAQERYQLPTNFSRNTIITIRGAGNYSACRSRLLQQINICSSGSNCSSYQTYQPSLNNSKTRFLFMAGYYSVFNSFASRIPITADSSRNYNLSSIDFERITTTIKIICNESWINVSMNADQFRPFLCFNSLYHWTLIQSGFSMNDENLKRSQVVRRINSNEIGWALGYMINQTNYLDPDIRPERIMTREEFIGILICFLVILAGSIIIISIALCFHIRRRRHGETTKQ